MAQNTADCVACLNTFSNLEPENARGLSLWLFVGTVIFWLQGSRGNKWVSWECVCAVTTTVVPRGALKSPCSALGIPGFLVLRSVSEMYCELGVSWTAQALWSSTVDPGVCAHTAFKAKAGALRKELPSSRLMPKLLTVLESKWFLAVVTSRLPFKAEKKETVASLRISSPDKLLFLRHPQCTLSGKAVHSVPG
ncbi:hypothetical protein H920_09299 [Fukomys damarensis]|uniref:Uncharacterized protein n=1 Tax=Fukomys damarensis TaxID=885580 RepID=A0A091DE52_FUKDA|nr:hypothetical protein H920_09299 [Fukomys damarensis]